MNWSFARDKKYILPITSLSFTFSKVVAEDVDQGQNGQVTYSIQSSGMSGLFKIDPMTGSITTAAIMDREIFTQTKWEQICGCTNLIKNHSMCTFWAHFCFYL